MVVIWNIEVGCHFYDDEEDENVNQKCDFDEGVSYYDDFDMIKTTIKKQLNGEHDQNFFGKKQQLTDGFKTLLYVPYKSCSDYLRTSCHVRTFQRVAHKAIEIALG